MDTLAKILLFLFGLIVLALFVFLRLERSITPRMSTRKFFGLSDLPIAKKLEGYLYATRTAQYLKMGQWYWLFEKLGLSESADTYHGKVLIKRDATKILTLNRPVDIYDLDKVIPYPVARSIILENPYPSVAVMECPCRAQKEDSCPREVCLVVGEPFVSFMVEHRPDITRRIEVATALQILDEEEARGHIHTAWFKDAMHNRFYAICNCCSCCCRAMASYFRGVPRMAHSGYSPVIQDDSCTGCGMCAEICPFQAIGSCDGLPMVDRELCMGCGLCVSHCPNGSINLVLAPDKGIPLDVEVLSEEASARLQGSVSCRKQAAKCGSNRPPHSPGGKTEIK